MGCANFVVPQSFEMPLQRGRVSVCGKAVAVATHRDNCVNFQYEKTHKPTENGHATLVIGQVRGEETAGNRGEKGRGNPAFRICAGGMIP
jgi:hypothetical protein